MGHLRTLRQLDVCRSPNASKLDFAGFDGMWISSDPHTRGIPRMDLEVREGRLFLRPYGRGDGGLIDWREHEADRVFTDGVASNVVAGFTADLDFGFMQSRLQVNLKIGVAVVCAFHRFQDDRRPIFWRELMARLPHETPSLVDRPRDHRCLRDLDSGTFTETGDIDPGSLVGHWRNTQSNPRGIRRVEIRPDRRRLRVFLEGATPEGSADWGTASGAVSTCVEEDDQSSAACHVVYDFGNQGSEVQVRQNKGVLAVTFFQRFDDDSGRRDWVNRELFYRSSATEKTP